MAVWKVSARSFLCAMAVLMNPAAAQSPTFGQSVPADSAEALRELLPLIPGNPPASVATGAEVVLISGYQPPNTGGSGTAVNVHVDRPGSKVLLVMTSYEKVNWIVSASAGTTISAIIVSGYQSPTVTTRVQTSGYRMNLPYAYELENIKFKDLLGRLKEALGVDKVDAFRGSYSIPLNVTISRPDPPRAELTLAGPKPKPPPKKFEFGLLTTDYASATWSLSGPIGAANKPYVTGGQVVASPNGKHVYRLVNGKLEILNRQEGKSRGTYFPPNFPEFSWPMDVAYDSRRDIVTVVTLGGEGFLYRFDATQERWVDFRSLNNIDIYALAYDGHADRYVAWTSNGALLFISGEGQALFSRDLRSKLEGFGRTYDRGNGMSPRLTIVAKGDDIALIHLQDGTVKRIWYYNVKSDSSVLTY